MRTLVEESRYLSFHGVRVHFRIARPEGEIRERALMLGSPLITTFHWRKLLPELAQLGCLTVLADLPGFGRSACLSTIPQDSFTQANMLWGVLDCVDDESGAPGSLWHLISHGSTCAAILDMGALCPDSVKSQVHISPLPRIPSPFGRLKPLRWYAETVEDAQNFRRWVEHMCSYPLDDYVLDRMRAPLLRPGARECFLRLLAMRSRLPDARPEFCPTMALLGSRDPLLTPPARADIAQCLEGAETHELKSAGHFPMETHSRALRDYLRGWFRYINS